MWLTSTAAKSPTPQGWSRPLPDTATLTWPGQVGRVLAGARRYRQLTGLPGPASNAVIVCVPLDSCDHIEVVWDLDHSCDYKPRQRHRVRWAKHPNADTVLTTNQRSLIGELRYGRIPAVSG